MAATPARGLYCASSLKVFSVANKHLLWRQKSCSHGQQGFLISYGLCAQGQENLHLPRPAKSNDCFFTLGGGGGSRETRGFQKEHLWVLAGNRMAGYWESFQEKWIWVLKSPRLKKTLKLFHLSVL